MADFNFPITAFVKSVEPNVMYALARTLPLRCPPSEIVVDRPIGDNMRFWLVQCFTDRGAFCWEYRQCNKDDLLVDGAVLRIYP